MIVFYYWMCFNEYVIGKHAMNTTRKQIFDTGKWEGNKEYNMIRSDKV